MLRKIDRILLRVPSLDSALAWYRDVLGMKAIKHDGRLATLRLGECDTELVLHNDADLPAEAVYYLVDDVRGMYAQRAKLKLTFVSPPSPVSRGFRATARDPFGNVLLLLDRTADRGGGIEDAKPPTAGLFAGVEVRTAVKRRELIEAYEAIGRTADDLPYTPHFETLYARYAKQHDPPPTRQEVWRHLLNLRKGGKLPKLGEARSRPPEVSAEDRAALREMLGTDIGKRDRLPYTKRFDALVDTFNKTQARPLSPHLVWRLVATLAK
jgi:catechol 2,3-dioxygenase-like lactoylglutathione lyase family enzyme